MNFEEPKVEVIRLNHNEVVFSSTGASCEIDNASASIEYCNGPGVSHYDDPTCSDVI